MELPMTPDVDAIRAALKQLQNEHRNLFDISADNAVLVANAPVWLAQCLDEIERLRAEAKDLFRSFPICSLSMQGGECSAEDRWKEVVAIVVAERDAALASREYWATERSEKISLDLAAALAECERLRNEKYLPAQLYKQITNDRDAWRACADQLAAALDSTDGMGKGIAAAYAEYVRLSA